MAWDDALTHPLVVSDDVTLRTLKDAGNYLVANIETGRLSPVLQDAMVLLMQASISGERSDIEAATEKVAAVLQVLQLAE